MTVLQDKFFAGATRMQNIIVRLVINQKQSRIGRPEPGKSKISCEYVIPFIVLYEGLQCDFRTKWERKFELRQVKPELPPRNFHIIVVDRKINLELIPDSITYIRRSGNSIASEKTACDKAQPKVQRRALVGRRVNGKLLMVIFSGCNRNAVYDVKSIDHRLMRKIDRRR